MKEFKLYQNGVMITSEDGSVTIIYFNKDSGKVFYRLKIDTLWDTKHLGIYIGADRSGTHYFMHNHYHVGKPCLTTLAEFTLGRPYFPYNATVTNDWRRIIENGLNMILKGEPYNSTQYNCQIFVNRACNNTNYSEDLNKWISRVVIGSAIVFRLNRILQKKY